MPEQATPERKSSHWLFKQSSELEILISAAIVFAAVTISGVVPDFLVKLINLNVPNRSPVLALFAFISLFLSILLPISIISHFVLRFYWLSLVGLRTAFERQHIERLNYADRYLKRLDKKNSLERHIDTIDKVCSSLFAFSFMSVFLFCFGLIIPFFIIGFLNDYLINELFRESWLRYVIAVVSVIFFLMCLLTLFDFLSLGLLKKVKKKWFVRLYYPVNRFMNMITFSVFYRDIYYSFVTNVRKWILIPILPLYLVMAILLLNYGYYESRYFADDGTAVALGSEVLLSMHYADQIDEHMILEHPFIGSVLQKDNFLKLSIPLTEEIDDWLAVCDSTSPIQQRGFHWRQWIKTGFNKRDLPQDFDYHRNAELALNCFSESIQVQIDDMNYEDLSLKFSKHNSPEKLVITTFLDISGLERGEHVLRIEGLPTRTTFEIPFIKD